MFKLYVFTNCWDHSEDSFYHPEMIISDSKQKAVEIFCKTYYPETSLPILTNTNKFVVTYNAGIGKADIVICEYDLIPNVLIDEHERNYA